MPPVPIHLRAELGDYADACLLPGDPLRAKYIAETFFEGAVEVNSYRGLLGYTGTFEGTRVSVQTSGMGCPSAAIVIEELVQLGVKKILRVGTCGGLQADIMGELIVPVAAAASDTTALQYVGHEAHVPTASFELVHELVHQAKELGKSVRVGPIVSSAVFYQPDPAQAQRWSDRGLLAVEMEAAVLFTLGALRKIQAGCVLLVSDLVIGGQFVYISDDDMRRAVDEMSQLALHAITASH
jgi:DeoD family purine-nucleoside phosphorylase